MLSKEQILQADDLAREQVPVPEWAPSGSDESQAFVYVRELSASERDAFDAETYLTKSGETTVNRQHYRARLLARAICDDKGKPLFKLGEVQQLGGKSQKVMDRLAEVALRLSAMTKAEQDDLLGNSAAGQTESSPAA